MNRRWKARLALSTATAAVVFPLVSAGLRSVALVAVALVGLAVMAAGAWGVLSRSGPARAFSLVVVIAAPLAVLAVYASVGMLWEALVSVVLWVLAGTAGRAALREADERHERPAGVPARPFLIMNPRSGGGKVGKFRLQEKAEALGAEVTVLDPAHPQDVAELARRAIEAGADLIGVAGGDGTQASVAEVAAAYDIPFMVISAGTRNHFAMDLGLDLSDPSKCLEALKDGVEVRVDLGFVGDRVFVNNASFGAYAAVVQSPAYRDDKVGTTLRTLPDLLTHATGPRLTVRAEDTTVEGPQAVLVSNNPYRTGDPAGLGRRDRLDQGTLGLLSLKVDNAVQAAKLLGGRLGPGLISQCAREVVVDADSARLDVGVDGEALTLPTPVRCRSAPGALRVVLPRHRPGRRSRPPLNWKRVRGLALGVGRTAVAGTVGEPGRDGSVPDRGPTGDGDVRRSWGRHRAGARVDYTGAVYGSLLAASVVVGAGSLGSFPRLQLGALLLCTAAVFWVAHVFARLFGSSLLNEPLTRAEIRRVCADERPILDTAVPPVVALAVSPLLGLGVQGAMWLALAVAITEQVGWAVVGAVRVGAPRRLVVIAALVNLLLGGVIIAAKVALTH